MSITKSRVSIFSAQTLTAGAGNQASSWVDLSAVYAAEVDVKITNGATGPTVAAFWFVDYANDYNAGSPTLITGGPNITSGTGNNTISTWTLEIPPATAAIRIQAGGNTAQNVTIDADLSKVTAI